MAREQQNLSDLEKVHAEAYRQYLRSLKEGLANLDIDALDVNDLYPSGTTSLLPFPMYCCLSPPVHNQTTKSEDS